LIIFTIHLGHQNPGLVMNNTSNYGKVIRKLPPNVDVELDEQFNR
jgi:hypothetical protein